MVGWKTGGPPCGAARAGGTGGGGTGRPGVDGGAGDRNGKRGGICKGVGACNGNGTGSCALACTGTGGGALDGLSGYHIKGTCLGLFESESSSSGVTRPGARVEASRCPGAESYEEEDAAGAAHASAFCG